jgi:hypothetical protein
LIIAVSLALSRADERLENTTDESTPIIDITTNNSISVNPLFIYFLSMSEFIFMSID